MSEEENGNGMKRFFVSIAVSIVGALLLQTGAFLYWAGGITVRVDRVERDVQTTNSCLRELQRDFSLRDRIRTQAEQ